MPTTPRARVLLDDYEATRVRAQAACAQLEAAVAHGSFTEIAHAARDTQAETGRLSGLAALLARD